MKRSNSRRGNPYPPKRRTQSPVEKVQNMLAKHGYERSINFVETNINALSLVVNALSCSQPDELTIHLADNTYTLNDFNIWNEARLLEGALFDVAGKITFVTDDGFVWSIACAIAHIDDVVL